MNSIKVTFTLTGCIPVFTEVVDVEDTSIPNVKKVLNDRIVASDLKINGTYPTVKHISLIVPA